MSIAGSRSVSQWLQASSSDPDSSPLDRIVVSSLMLVGIAVLLKRGSKVRTLLLSNLPVVVFFLYCAFSVVWSEFPVATITRWWKAVGDLVMIMIVLTDAAPIEAVGRVLSRVSFFLLPFSMLFIKYYPALGRYYDYWEGRQYYSGVSVDKNMLGVSCMAFALASTWYLIDGFWDPKRERKTGSFIAHGVVVYMALWLFVRIDSMTSLGCFMLAASLIAAMRIPFVTQAAWIRHGLLAFVTLFTLTVLLFGLGGSILKSMGRDPTLTGRTDLWAALSTLNPNPLFGPGFEAFWRGPRLEKIARTIGHANEAHNGYFEVYLNLGWAGLTLLTLVIALGYRNISRVIRVDPRTGRLWLAYFIAGLVYSITEAGFRVQGPMWITFLLAIIGSTATSTRPNDINSNAALPARWKGGTIDKNSSQVIRVPKWSPAAAHGNARHDQRDGARRSSIDGAMPQEHLRRGAFRFTRSEVSADSPRKGPS